MTRPHFDALLKDVSEFELRLKEIKKEAMSFPWYPWHNLNNLVRRIGAILPPEFDDLFAPSKTFADIGAADGDLSFYLQSKGYSADIYDWPPTNMNGLQGAYSLKNRLSSSVQIFQTDLDSQFRIDSNYETIFLFGILYHLKNPYFVLEQLSTRSKFMFLTTRTIRTFAAGAPDISQFSASYLLGPTESNNDSTNYWLFTEPGLTKLLGRTGWTVVSQQSGALDGANPHDKDERIILLAKSTRT